MLKNKLSNETVSSIMQPNASKSKRAQASDASATTSKKLARDLVFELEISSPAKTNRFTTNPYDDSDEEEFEPVKEIHKTQECHQSWLAVRDGRGRQR